MSAWTTVGAIHGERWSDKVKIEEVPTDNMTGGSATNVLENECECHSILMKYYSTGII